MPETTIEKDKIVDNPARFKFMRFLRNDVMEKFEPKQNVKIGGNNIYLDGAIVDSDTARMINEDEDEWGYPCISSEELRDAFAGVSGEINVFLNSPGGDVWEGARMLTAFEDKIAQGNTINLIVDGICASAATYMLLAEGLASRQITKFSQVMIHNCWAGCAGNANELRKMADLLDETDANYANKMAEIMNASVEEVSELMDGETWFVAEKAIEIGLIQKLYVSPNSETESGDEEMADSDASENEDNNGGGIDERVIAQTQRLLLGL